jgi:hypothetical protein
MADTTNPSQSDIDTVSRYQTARVVGNVQQSNENTQKEFIGLDSRRVDTEPGKPESAKMLSTSQKELRVRIQVPETYITNNSTQGYEQNIYSMGGIVFPYTPQISFEHVAEYSSQNPTHSNYAINFYKHSSVSDINIEGVFTVQNDKDAITYLSIIHVLRVLTKMRFGGSDPLRGSPPPVCRLYAYGTYMLDNVPIAIKTFKNSLSNDVDYYYLNDNSYGFGKAYVPARSTISLTCKPMYSRNEMLDATVGKWVSSDQARSSGLL